MMAGNVVKIFVDLVEIPSPTDEEEKVGQYIVKRLHGVADAVKFDKHGNVYVHLEGRGVPLFLTSHMDTVRPAGKFRAKVSKGYVTSDGKSVLGADDKAGIAAIIDAIERLKKSGATHRPIDVAFTKSEEIGSYGAVYFDYSLIKAREGFCLDSNAPVGEIVVASPYYNSFELTLQGKSAHASKPEMGRNALLAFSFLLRHLRMGRLNKSTVANIGIVRAGEVRNAIPGSLVAEGEVRSFNMRYVSAYKKHLAAELEVMRKKYKVNYKLHLDKTIPGYTYNKRSKEWKQVRMAEKSMHSCGVKPVIRRPWESTDTNVFMSHGIKCVVLAHGSENAHTPRERIKVSDLHRLSDIVFNIALL
jgi:tripeptide aminopeptidase